jgi:NAD(P)-dependent dehydrogenase (short-subunit alcohol dehydrogenase family)
VAVTEALVARLGYPCEPPLPVGPRLAGKVAVVVGAGQLSGDTIGNGRATAIAFAMAGASLLLVDMDRSSLEDTRSLAEGYGADVEVLVGDVTDEEQAASITRRCVDRFGRIDVLHNNVGTGVGDGGITTMARTTWDRIFAVNVTGVYLTCKHAVPEMRRRGRGSIVNVSSIASVVSTQLAAYKSSKAALNALTHHLATANARHGIRVNAILPGALDTPMAIVSHSTARGMDPAELRAERDAQVPLGNRMGTAWDTAFAALYLASDEAAFVTGVMLPVDGGASARSG